MPQVMQMKDGKVATVFDDGDVLEIVEDYAGPEPREYLESSLAEADEEQCDFEAQEKYYEDKLERLADHQRAVLNDIKEELEALEEQLDAPRLNRGKLRETVKRIWQMAWREL